jgi:hypothetical protein
MKPEGVPPSDDDFLQIGEALLDAGSWSEEKATAPLRLSFEVHDRTAACIRLSAAVSGLPLHEVARRWMLGCNCAGRTIEGFSSNFFNSILQEPSAADVEAVTAKLLEFQKAGHIQGFTPYQLQVSIMKALTGEDWETSKLLAEAAKLINAASDESMGKS